MHSKTMGAVKKFRDFFYNDCLVLREVNHLERVLLVTATWSLVVSARCSSEEAVQTRGRDRGLCVTVTRRATHRLL
jgi:hypothetical protein